MAEAPEYLTVPELAALLRIKERKVYDLAAGGEVPVSRATGKLLFPEREVRAWIDGKKTPAPRLAARPNVLIGSFDPLLEWAIRQSECGMASLLDGSADGLRRFVAGEGVAAGMHIHDAGTDDWNVAAVAKAAKAQNAVLLAWAKRQRGLVLHPDMGSAITSVADLRGKTLATRQKASGTDLLLSHVLEAAGVQPDQITRTDPFHSEQDAVLAVVEGQAQATFGLEAVARPFGLPFVPVTEERFDLLIDRKAYFDPAIQTLLRFCRTPAFAAKASAFGGYDTTDLGEVRWSA